MVLVSSEKIKCAITDEKRVQILETLEEQFKKVSQKCSINEKRHADYVKAEMISATFGSINRQDVSLITVTETKKGDGYRVNVETTYKPSTAFWIFLIVLLFTYVGWVIPIGMYFYNKSLVQKTIADVLKKVRDDEED